ncbi:MAG: helix-turn-helix transcriptional regulator [Bacteroidetes bacterium]|nr:helix-turn-helix transcriptional regulator [Bacteroidota bacterium]
MTDEACFFYVMKGQGDTVSETEMNNLSPSGSLLMKCGNYILRALPVDHEQTFQAVAIHFYPEVLQKIYRNDLPDFFIQKPAQRKSNAVSINTDYLLRMYIESMVFYFENPDLISEDLLVLKFKELVLLLLRTEESNEIQLLFRELFSPTERSFKQIIDAHLFHDLNLGDLATLTGCSLSSFKREFVRIFNETPATYVRTKKLDKACELLRLSNERISDIAFTCGFSNADNFSRLFMQKFGVTPSNYRLNQKAGLLNNFH